MYDPGTDAYIEAVVRKYSPALLRAAFSVLRNTADAQDAAQEAFLRLLEKRPAFNDGQHEKAWLLRVTINIAKNMRSAAARTEPIEENTAFVYEEYSETLNAVLSLPVKYRTVIHLYYYEGYSIKEIAAILEVPAATVGTILSRGREKLRTMLKEEIEGEDEI